MTERKGVHIEFSGGFLLTSDAHQWIINRQYSVDPKKSPSWSRLKAEGHDGSIRIEWREDSYHPKLSDALTKISDTKARESGATSLSDLLAEIKGFRREISRLTSGLG